MSDIICRVCGRDDFESWDDLTNHVLERCKVKNDPHNKDRAGKMWAKRYHHRKTINKMRKLGKDQPYRQPLTEEQKEAKQDTRRILSKQTMTVPTKCPKCQKDSRQPIEKEHAESSQAWKIDNCFMIICEGSEQNDDFK